MAVISGITDTISAITQLNTPVRSSEDTPIDEILQDSIDYHNSHHQAILNDLLATGVNQILYGIIDVVNNGLAINTTLKSSRPGFLIPWLIEGACSVIIRILLIVKESIFLQNDAKATVYFLSAGTV